MRREIELIRKIILAAEASARIGSGDLQVAGYTEDQIGYHSYLIVDAGLAKGVDATCIGDSNPKWIILHLTSAGHDFADASRNETTWKKALGLVADKGGNATIGIVRDVLVGVIKGSLGLT